MITKLKFDHAAEKWETSVSGCYPNLFKDLKRNWNAVVPHIAKQPVITDSELMEYAISIIPDNLSDDEIAQSGIFIGMKLWEKFALGNSPDTSDKHIEMYN